MSGLQPDKFLLASEWLQDRAEDHKAKKLNSTLLPPGL
jgi:hypothetical protein